jgi:hypothetical protein
VTVEFSRLASQEPAESFSADVLEFAYALRRSLPFLCSGVLLSAVFESP